MLLLLLLLLIIIFLPISLCIPIFFYRFFLCFASVSKVKNDANDLLVGNQKKTAAGVSYT